MPNSYDVAIAVLLGIGGAGCSTAGSAERTDTPRELVVRAADYSFSAPDTIPAGLTSVRLENDGHEMHHVQLMRIADGYTIEDLRASAASGILIPAWATPIGGPNASSPKN